MRYAIVIGASVVLASVAGADSLPPTATSPRAFFVGTWSFDGTCASGDGMVLKRDGKASYDEWGTGFWAVADIGQRLVLLVEDISEEADRRTNAELIEFRVVQRTNNGNGIVLTRLPDGTTINARRCRGTQG